MKIRQDGQEGRYCVACWERKPRPDKDADAYEYHDGLDHAESRIKALRRGGRFDLIALYEWSDDGWQEIETYATVRRRR